MAVSDSSIAAIASSDVVPKHPFCVIRPLTTRAIIAPHVARPLLLLTISSATNRNTPDQARTQVRRDICYFFPFASSAARTLGGDIGSSVSRVPTARSIALAIAAIGGQMLTSAAPLAP